MKKVIIVTLVLVLLLVGSIWGYLMVFGTPSSASDVFADLGIGNSDNRQFEGTENIDSNPTSSDEVVAPNSKKLKLLSLRTTAGSVVLGSTTTDHVVRMVERGTGHIYDINPKTNQETRVSGTTYAGITNAYLSPDGSYAVLLANKSIGRSVHLVSFSSSTEAKLLPSDASEFGFSDDSKSLYYVRSDKNGSVGYAYSLGKGQDTALFSVPFLAISVAWGDEVIIYNRPGEGYPGYAYTITPAGGLASLTTGGVGLTVFRAGETTFVNRHSQDGYQAYIVKNNEADMPIGMTVMPEKCAAGTLSTNIIWCGDSIASAKTDAPISWYKGEKALVDRLYKIDLKQGSISPASSLDEEAGRSLDVVGMTASHDGSALVFTDKNTNTLWYFDTTVQ